MGDTFQPIDREGMKQRLFLILIDFLGMESEIDLEEVGPILQKHLGLSDEDIDEVMARFRGEMRDLFANHPNYAGSSLAQALDEKEGK